MGGRIVAKLRTTNPGRFYTPTLGGSAGARLLFLEAQLGMGMDAVTEIEELFAGAFKALALCGFWIRGTLPD